jgi:hypothetical protein
LKLAKLKLVVGAAFAAWRGGDGLLCFSTSEIEDGFTKSFASTLISLLLELMLEP